MNVGRLLPRRDTHLATRPVASHRSLMASGPPLCLPFVQAESYVRQCLDKINAQPCFKTAGVRWDLHKSCGFPCATSWIEVSFRLPEEDHLLSLPDHEEEV